MNTATVNVAPNVGIADLVRFLKPQTGLEDDDLLNAYLWGSRAYQCHTPVSDYDVLCVVEDGRLESATYVESEWINAMVYPWAAFRQMVLESNVTILTSCYLPAEYVWRERRRCEPQIDPHQLIRSVLRDSSHNFQKAKRLMAQGDLKKGRKNIVHCFRYLLFGLQILKDGRITDYSAAAEHYRRVNAIHSDAWAPYEEEFKQEFKTLSHQVRHFFGEADPQAPLPSGEAGWLELQRRLLEEQDPGRIQPRFGVTVQRHTDPDCSSLVLFSEDELVSSASVDIRLFRSCSRFLLVDTSADHRIVAAGMPCMFNMDQEGELAAAETRLIPLLGGVTVAVYYFAGRWQVCCHESADGTTQLTSPANPPLVRSEAVSPTCRAERRSRSVRDLFWELFETHGCTLPADTSGNFCYVFEIASPNWCCRGFRTIASLSNNTLGEWVTPTAAWVPDTEKLQYLGSVDLRSGCTRFHTQALPEGVTWPVFPLLPPPVQLNRLHLRIWSRRVSPVATGCAGYLIPPNCFVDFPVVSTLVALLRSVGDAEFYFQGKKENLLLEAVVLDAPLGVINQAVLLQLVPQAQQELFAQYSSELDQLLEKVSIIFTDITASREPFGKLATEYGCAALLHAMQAHGLSARSALPFIPTSTVTRAVREGGDGFCGKKPRKVRNQQKDTQGPT